MLPIGDDYAKEKVVGQKKYTYGNPFGDRNSNPLLDYSVYTVEFNDGTLHEYAANIVA